MDRAGVPAGLLERSGELSRRADLVRRARMGSGCFALVEGPAGIGKTSLLDVCVEQARELGVATLRATGATGATGTTGATGATTGERPPTISGAALTLSKAGRDALRFTAHAGQGAPALSSLTIVLPPGLSYGPLRARSCHRAGRVKRCSTAVKGLTVRGATLGAARRARGALTITLAKPVRSLSVSVISPLLRTLSHLHALLDRRRGKQHTITLDLTVRMTDSSHHTTSASIRFKRRVRE